MFEVATIIVLLCLRNILKNNSGKLRCKGVIGKLIEHRFIEHLGNRVCSICGLVQKEGPAGILAADGDTWYDKGYAENKVDLVAYIREKKRISEEKYLARKKEKLSNIKNTKIKTPSIKYKEKRSKQ